MSKYQRFASTASHGGYVAGPTVAMADKLDILMGEFKLWFTSMDGFGEYLRSFFSQYDAYFDDNVEEHGLVYTQLHKEFSMRLEESIDQWLHSKGIAEDSFGEMLELAKRRGDEKSDEILGTLLGMMDYQLWISHIFRLKHDSRVAALLLGQPPLEDSAIEAAPESISMSPQGGEWPAFNAVAPDGLLPGHQFQVSTPDSQVVVATVPEGYIPGQVISVSYVPAAAPPAPQAAGGGQWRSYLDDAGKVYYHDTVSGTTAWDLPSGAVLLDAALTA